MNKRVRGRKCTDARARPSLISDLIIVWIIFNEDINNVLSSPLGGGGGGGTGRRSGTVLPKEARVKYFCSSSMFTKNNLFSTIKSVFRIHAILVWNRIRIWICGSMTLTNGSGSCYFRNLPSRCQQKTNIKIKFSAYYFLKVHLQHFSKIKSQKEVTKQ